MTLPQKKWMRSRVGTRGGASLSRVMIAEGEPDAPMRATYKALGYRLITTEGFFIQPLKRIPKPPSSATIERGGARLRWRAPAGQDNPQAADFSRFAPR